MSDDLAKQSIEELRELMRCRCHPAYTDRGLHNSECMYYMNASVKIVADRIEELEAALPEQIEWVKRLADDLNAAEGREARLEAKLAKAVEALEGVRAFVRDLAPYADQGHTLVPALEKACTTLAELTGGKDD